MEEIILSSSCRAKVKDMVSEIPRATASKFDGYKSRTPDARTIAENGKKKSTLDEILFGNRKIDLRAVSQLVEVGQTRTITEALLVMTFNVITLLQTQEIVKKLSDDSRNEECPLNPPSSLGLPQMVTKIMMTHFSAFIN